jgi:hypothetical protein
MLLCIATLHCLNLHTGHCHLIGRGIQLTQLTWALRIAWPELHAGPPLHMKEAYVSANMAAFNNGQVYSHKQSWVQPCNSWLLSLYV